MPPLVTEAGTTAALTHLSAADEVMGRLIASSAPLPPLTDEPYFHALASAIVGQQLSGKAAATILRRLVETVASDGILLPNEVAAIDHDALRAVGLSNAKARYLRALADAVLNGSLDLEGLQNCSDEEVIAALTAVKGIGRWTAEMFLLFTLGRSDVLSTGDFGIRAAVRRLYGLAELPSPTELRAIAEPWHPYCSTALLLLWQSLDNRPPVATDVAGT